MCPQHDPTGALTLVASNEVWNWNQQPENHTNAAQVLAGTHAAVYRARPTWDMPTAHVNNAASAVVSIYREDVTRHTDYTLASKALAKALLESIGDKNQVLLKTLHPTLKIYSLTPRQIVDAMVAKHGIPTSEDIHKLREPLSLALMSLSDLESHMGNVLLASQRLTRSGQGETPYHYFELYLVTVAGFPSVALAMMGYYSRYPAITQQNLANLFPFLDDMKDHLIQLHHSREQQKDPPKHQHGDPAKSKPNETKSRDSNSNPSHPAQLAGALPVPSTLLPTPPPRPTSVTPRWLSLGRR
jgi:hypothetical protein